MQVDLRPSDYGRVRRFVATVHPRNEIAEENEQNNRLRIAVRVIRPMPPTRSPPAVNSRESWAGADWRKPQIRLLMNFIGYTTLRGRAHVPRSPTAAPSLTSPRLARQPTDRFASPAGRDIPPGPVGTGPQAARDGGPGG
jgi:hypothetical protein